MNSIRYCILFTLPLLFFSCSEESEMMKDSDKIEDCQLDDFYARMLINGECWVATLSFFEFKNNLLIISLNNVFNLTEELAFVLNPDLAFNKNLYDLNSNDSSVGLGVIEGFDSFIAIFETKNGDDNWIQLENFNSDTTIINGRFETVLYRNNPQGNQSIYPSPEKLVITDGQFRVQRRE